MPSTWRTSSSATSVTPPSPARFVLDENFPQPILGLEILRKAVRRRISMDIVLLEDVDPDLFGYHDHDLVRALADRGVEGLFTCDDAMVFRPEVLQAILDTGFSVVTCRRAGDDPILASGLILAHLGEIGSEHRRGSDQIWRLGAAAVKPMRVAEQRALIS